MVENEDMEPLPTFDWTSLIPLGAFLAGAIVTLVGQRLSDGRRAKTERQNWLRDKQLERFENWLAATERFTRALADLSKQTRVVNDLVDSQQEQFQRFEAAVGDVQASGDSEQPTSPELQQTAAVEASALEDLNTKLGEAKARLAEMKLEIPDAQNSLMQSTYAIELIGDAETQFLARKYLEAIVDDVDEHTRNALGDAVIESMRQLFHGERPKKPKPVKGVVWQMENGQQKKSPGTSNK